MRIRRAKWFYLFIVMKTTPCCLHCICNRTTFVHLVFLIEVETKKNEKKSLLFIFFLSGTYHPYWRSVCLKWEGIYGVLWRCPLWHGIHVLFRTSRKSRWKKEMDLPYFTKWSQFHKFLGIPLGLSFVRNKDVKYCLPCRVAASSQSVRYAPLATILRTPSFQ